MRALRKCTDCGVFTSNDPHICVTYTGPACTTCGEPTTWYTVGAPGYGQGRVCPLNHHEPHGPHGILTADQVR
jgi:hypothetical protein